VVLALHAWRNAAHFGPWLDGVRDGLMERLQWWLLLLSAVMFSMSGCSSVRSWQATALRDWHVWAEHPTHFASGHHMAFSVKSHKTAASITPADAEAAEREEWWGRVVPQTKAPAVVAKASAPGSKAPSDSMTTPADTAGQQDAAGPQDSAAQDKSSVVAASAPAPARVTSLKPSARAEIGEISGRWRGRWWADGAWGERRESEAQMVFVQSGDGGTGEMRLSDTVAAVGVPEVVRYLGALGTPMKLRVSRREVVARYESGPAVFVRFSRVGDRLYGRIDNSPSFLMVLDRQ
jgi:hypothetical protein